MNSCLNRVFGNMGSARYYNIPSDEVPENAGNGTELIVYLLKRRFS